MLCFGHRTVADMRPTCYQSLCVFNILSACSSSSGAAGTIAIGSLLVPAVLCLMELPMRLFQTVTHVSILVYAFGNVVRAQTIRVDAIPSHSVNKFSPLTRWVRR